MGNMNKNKPLLSRGRIQLLSIFALFSLAPVSAILVWQYLGEHGVGSTTNNGALISPARPLAFEGSVLDDGSTINDRQLKGAWLYVISGVNGCREDCLKQLYVTRQTRIAVSKDMPRVKRIILLTREADSSLREVLKADHPDLLVTTFVPEKLLEKFEGSNFSVNGKQYFLVDPLGNLMMFYGTDSIPRGVLKDLQKLLKISQVG